MINIKQNVNNGFTLIEMLVAIFIFSIVMVIASGAVISIINANQKARAVQVVTNNLNLALESMTRDIRFGYDTQVSESNSKITLNKSVDGSVKTIVYEFNSTGNYVNKTVDNNTGKFISEGVKVDYLNFYKTNKRVLILIGGSVLRGSNIISTFNMQTTVYQRNI